MGSGVGGVLQPKYIVRALSLIAVIALGIWLLAVRSPSPVISTSLKPLPATPVDTSIVSRHSQTQEWKSSASIFQNRLPPHQAAPSAERDRPAVTFDSALEETAMERFAAQPSLAFSETESNPLPGDPVVRSFEMPSNPAMIRAAPLIPPSFRSDTSTWRPTRPIPVVQVTELRQRIATGEKIVPRARRSDPGPLDKARKRAMERRIGQ